MRSVKQIIIMFRTVFIVLSFIALSVTGLASTSYADDWTPPCPTNLYDHINQLLEADGGVVVNNLQKTRLLVWKTADPEWDTAANTIKHRFISSPDPVYPGMYDLIREDAKVFESKIYNSRAYKLGLANNFLTKCFYPWTFSGHAISWNDGAPRYFDGIAIDNQVYKTVKFYYYLMNRVKATELSLIGKLALTDLMIEDNPTNILPDSAIPYVEKMVAAAGAVIVKQLTDPTLKNPMIGLDMGARQTLEKLASAEVTLFKLYDVLFPSTQNSGPSISQAKRNQYVNFYRGELDYERFLTEELKTTYGANTAALSPYKPDFSSMTLGEPGMMSGHQRGWVVPGLDVVRKSIRLDLFARRSEYEDQWKGLERAVLELSLCGGDLEKLKKQVDYILGHTSGPASNRLLWNLENSKLSDDMKLMAKIAADQDFSTIPGIFAAFDSVLKSGHYDTTTDGRSDDEANLDFEMVNAYSYLMAVAAKRVDNQVTGLYADLAVIAATAFVGGGQLAASTLLKSMASAGKIAGFVERFGVLSKILSAGSVQKFGITLNILELGMRGVGTAQLVYHAITSCGDFMQSVVAGTSTIPTFAPESNALMGDAVKWLNGNGSNEDAVTAIIATTTKEYRNHAAFYSCVSGLVTSYWGIESDVKGVATLKSGLGARRALAYQGLGKGSFQDLFFVPPEALVDAGNRVKDGRFLASIQTVLDNAGLSAIPVSPDGEAMVFRIVQRPDIPETSMGRIVREFKEDNIPVLVSRKIAADMKARNSSGYYLNDFSPNAITRKLFGGGPAPYASILVPDKGTANSLKSVWNLYVTAFHELIHGKQDSTFRLFRNTFHMEMSARSVGNVAHMVLLKPAGYDKYASAEEIVTFTSGVLLQTNKLRAISENQGNIPREVLLKEVFHTAVDMSIGADTVLRVSTVRSDAMFTLEKKLQQIIADGTSSVITKLDPSMTQNYLPGASSTWLIGSGQMALSERLTDVAANGAGIAKLGYNSKMNMLINGVNEDVKVLKISDFVVNHFMDGNNGIVLSPVNANGMGCLNVSVARAITVESVATGKIYQAQTGTWSAFNQLRIGNLTNPDTTKALAVVNHIYKVVDDTLAFDAKIIPKAKALVDSYEATAKSLIGVADGAVDSTVAAAYASTTSGPTVTTLISLSDDLNNASDAVNDTFTVVRLPPPLPP